MVYFFFLPELFSIHRSACQGSTDCGLIEPTINWLRTKGSGGMWKPTSDWHIRKDLLQLQPCTYHYCILSNLIEPFGAKDCVWYLQIGSCKGDLRIPKSQFQKVWNFRITLTNQYWSSDFTGLLVVDYCGCTNTCNNTCDDIEDRATTMFLRWLLQ